MILKEIYFSSGKAYLILSKIPIYIFTKNDILNRDKLNLYKEWYRADHILKTDSHFMFVENIEDVEFEEMVLDY